MHNPLAPDNHSPRITRHEKLPRSTLEAPQAMGTLDILIDWSGSGSRANTHKSSPDEADEAPSPSPSPIHFPPGLILAPGRPHLLKFIEHALQRAVTLGSREGYTKTQYAREKDETLGLSGLVMGMCGLVGPGDEVATAVGVVVEEEVFGW